MKISFIDSRKEVLFRFTWILTMTISILSCNNESEDSLVPKFDVSGVSALSADFEVKSSYYNEDSIKLFNLNASTEDYGSVKNARLFNSFGSGSTNQSIFRTLPSDPPLDSIVKYSLNEVFTKKVIISWDLNRNNQIVDSITTKILGNSSEVDISMFDLFTADSCIYIDFLVVNKFGDVVIDFENSKINDFLDYKSSNYGDQVTDAITLDPQQFKQLYGDEFTSTLTLGTFLHCQFRISSIDCIAGKEDAILLEAMDMIRKVIDENAAWEDLASESKYFKNYLIRDIKGTAIPTCSFIFGVDDAVKEFSNIDSLYKKPHFGILAKGYEPFSKLYPKYEFLK